MRALRVAVYSMIAWLACVARVHAQHGCYVHIHRTYLRNYPVQHL
ncbi:hypothetical protein HMPREF9248_0375 [Fannyhessea vaginae PB189-T1-4]|uniref:Uncharacterized protein n=1 Tax=Fannyhessea vaginae PB189-T1-4 TaxID=866774 RepID=A0ABN0AZU4_9ACTN|nr:hypothetical protein HMPREF9248_0375 [Fannyhessea vaginae PB189-T1-4]